MEFDCGTFNIVMQIIAAVGSLATFGAFIFLFKRDKDKQAQIDKLAGIATILEAQNELMRQQNDLMLQQIDVFRNTNILKGHDEAALSQLKEIEVKKLKLSVMPNLWLNGAGYDGLRGELKIDLNNKGEDAKLIDFILSSNDIILHSESLPWDLEKGERRYIFARTNGTKHIKDCEYEIDVIYEDKLQNKYKLKLEGKGASVRVVSNNELG